MKQLKKKSIKDSAKGAIKNRAMDSANAVVKDEANSTSKDSAHRYQWFWDRLDQHLSQKKLKQTQQRKMIVRHLLEADRHIDAETLYEVLRKKHKEIGIATVYRTLSLLKEAGLVDQKDFIQGRAVFEVAFPGHHHDHLICLDCGKVFEFENEEIEVLQKQIAKSHNFKLHSHRLDLFGHCEKANCEFRGQRQS